MAGSFNLEFASRISDVARAAYPDRAHRFLHWRPDTLVPFETEHFSGFVASNRDMTVCAFRGTRMHLDSYESILNSIGQWLRNLDYEQVNVDGCRLHRGYYRELDAAYGKIVELLRAQHKEGRPVVLAGHSAGGALATIAGSRLVKTGADPIVPSAVYAFSPPRVGCKHFASTYPVPLLRFERGHDLVPHLPLCPSLARAAGVIGVDRALAALYKVGNFFGADLGTKGLRARDVEYRHAGTLYYHENDADDNFWTSGSLMGTIGAMFDEKPKVVPLPKWLLDPGRFLNLFVHASDELDKSQSVFTFIKDHGLDLTTAFCARLMGTLTGKR
jgi:pimeloyl-ACP methyl ester carboxylesterase